MRRCLEGTVFALLGFGIFGLAPVRTQGQTPKQNQPPLIQVGTSYHNDVSPPLRDMVRHWRPAPGMEGRLSTLSPEIHHNDAGSPNALIQNIFALRDIPSPILNFDGVPFGVGVSDLFPPDTNGAVGPTQYVQAVNNGFEVFDKATGASLLGPATLASLWSGFGGACASLNSFNPNEPMVLYDHLANRWIIARIVPISSPANCECIAISDTSDATGTYHRYGFVLGTNFFANIRLSLWPDAYYMSTDVFNSSGTAYLGPQPFAFERAKLLNGQPGTYITPGLLGGSVPPILPAHLDGSTLPPSGAPGTFVGFPRNGQYTTYHFHVDFATPNNSTWTTFATPAATTFTELCPQMSACVPQPDTTVRLGGLGRTLMFRLAYRNFAGHESVVGNYAVTANDVAGIRWFELRNVTSGPVTVYQESTYQPDTTWRWTGSAAMDRAGNLALGFSASSSTVYPSIRYTGRLVSDPLDTLPQGEATLLPGGGSQTASTAWGNISSMSVDPVDDCTFWYTNEYYQATSSFNWRTRIGNFKFKECTAGPTLTPSPTPTATATATATATGTPTTTPTPSPTPTASPTPAPTATPSPSPATAQLLNLSTRVRVETGDNLMIGGFIINGAGSLQVVIRGIGPSLGQQGISDFLPDPILELRDSSGSLLVTNDNWQDDPTQVTQLLKLGLAPGNPAESALLRALQPGAYTAIITGKNGGTGVGLVEVYNVDHSVPVANIQLANISTRGHVQTGANVMIGGFILGGSSNNTGIVVRGIGPSLAQSGVSNVLADPTLELRDGNGMLLIVNDNWQDDPAAAAQLTAHGLAPPNPLESGIFASLPPGLYTAILAGKDGGTGIGLVEIYNLGFP